MNWHSGAAAAVKVPRLMRLRVPIVLLVILAVALAARIAVIVATPDFMPLFDAADFHRHATSIADGNGYPSSQLGVAGPTAFRPPLYPLALAGVQVLGGEMDAERVLGALLGVVTVLLVFLIAQRIWERSVALVAAAIAAIFPPLVTLNASLLSEVLFIPLVLAGVLAVLEYRDTRRMRWAIVAGVLCGLAALTRANGLVLVLAFAIGVWTVRPWRSRAAFAAPAVVVLATVVTLAPWVIRNTIEFDRFVGISTGGGYALAGTYNEESKESGEHPGQPFSPNQLETYRATLSDRSGVDEAEVIGKLNDRAVDYITSHPLYVVKTVAWNVPRVLDIVRWDTFERAFAARQVQALGVERIDSPWLFLGSLYAILVLALVGVAAHPWMQKSKRAPLFYWATPVLLALPALAIYGLPRYRAPLDPFFVMLAAVGIVVVVERLRPPAAEAIA
jgi:4-amino-4-deoxy-L-arabinose transferase-like glycosyltransferase